MAELSFNEHFARLSKRLDVITIDDLLRASRDADHTMEQRNVFFKSLYNSARLRKSPEYLVRDLKEIDNIRGRRVLFSGMEKTITDYQAPIDDSNIWQLVLDGMIFNTQPHVPFLLLTEDM